jgi:ABC-2 type transport system ATP-binding protein
LVLRAAVRALADDGRIIFYSSHQLETIEKISTRVIILRAGVIVADDSASRLRDLMQAPSLEDVFSQLTVTVDTGQLASELLETVRR